MNADERRSAFIRVHPRLNILQDTEPRTKKNRAFISLCYLKRLDRCHRSIDRAEQVWIITAHHHVLRANHVSHHLERVWTKRDGVVIESLQINTRQLVDLHTAISEVTTPIVHPFHQIRYRATEMSDDPTNFLPLLAHTVITH